MNTGICKALDPQSWRDAYQAAMCESDLNKLPERIADAEGLATIADRVRHDSGAREWPARRGKVGAAVTAV